MRYMDFNEDREHTTNGFPLAYYLASRDAVFNAQPLHWHKEFEFSRIISGSISFFINDKWYHLTAGDCFIVQPGELHGCRQGNFDLECIVFDTKQLLSFSHPFLCNDFEKLLSGVKILSRYSPSDKEMCRLLGRAISECRTDILQKKYTIIGRILEVFGWIDEHHLYSTTNKNPNLQIDRIKRVFEYIDAHYASPISLDKLASLAGMSTAYFSSFFSNVMHRSPVDYLNAYRVSKACSLLQLDPDETITNVAFACGFSSSSYFVKTFKKYQGITPKQYQLNVINKLS